MALNRIEIHFNYEDEIAEFVECAAMHENERKERLGAYEMCKLYEDDFLYGEGRNSE